MMQSVEDIPSDAILGGLPWDWETHPQYLDSVQRMEPALNVVSLVGHCAVRYQVMGERSLGDEEPTPAELDRMREIVGESIAGGAVGYSTSRILVHTVPDGRKVPGTYASTAEHLALADGMNDAGGGIFQAVNDFESRAGTEFELLRAMAEHAGDVLFAVGPGNDASGDSAVVDLWDGFLADTRANAGNITAYTMTRPSGSLAGLAQVPPVRGARWRALMQLPTLEDRVDALSDDATRAELIAEAEAKGMLYDPEFIHPLGTGDGAGVRRRGREVAGRPRGRGRRAPGRDRDRPAARERGTRAVQHVVLPPEPRRDRRPARARRGVPGCRRRRCPRRPDLRRRRADALPLVLVP